MGLDNGVCVRRTPETNKIQTLEDLNFWGLDKEKKYDFDIVYYRKCWNIRNDLFHLGIGYDQGEYPMSAQDVDKMIALLSSYNSENFEDGGGCIWEWDDEDYPYSEKIKQDIKALKTLRELMDKHELEVYFYDSY